MVTAAAMKPITSFGSAGGKKLNLPSFIACSTTTPTPPAMPLTSPPIHSMPITMMIICRKSVTATAHMPP